MSPTILGFHGFLSCPSKTHPSSLHPSTQLLVTLQGVSLQRFIGEGILPAQGVVRRKARARGGDLADFCHGKADGKVMAWWILEVPEAGWRGCGKVLGESVKESFDVLCAVC